MLETLNNEQRLLFATERVSCRQGTRSQISILAITVNDSVESQEKKRDEQISDHNDGNSKDFDPSKDPEATRKPQDDISDNETQSNVD